MNRSRTILIVLLAIAISAHAGLTEADIDTVALKPLKGCSTYSRKLPHSGSAQAVYLGYDDQGTIVAAVVVKTVKSWKKMTVVMTIRLKDKKYVVDSIDLPDIEKRIKKSKYRKKGPIAVKATLGKTVRNEDRKNVPIDAVSGATKYSKKLYAEFDGMAELAIKEILAKPDWKKTKLD